MPRSPQHWSGRLLRFVRICRGMLEMPLDVIVVMDPIGSIKIAKDSTFAMLLEAQRRAHRLHYVIPGGLSLHGGNAVAQVAPLAVRARSEARRVGKECDSPCRSRWSRKHEKKKK